MDDATFEKLLSEAEGVSEKYLEKAKYDDITQPIQLDVLLVDVVGDWIQGKIDELVLSTICSTFEADPLHHKIYNKKPLYLGIDLTHYIIEGDTKSIEETKRELKSWYESL